MTTNQAMKRGRSRRVVALVGGLVALILAARVTGAAEAPVGLGTAGSFAVLAGAGVTNSGPTVITGDLGTCPTIAITGFPPGMVVGGTTRAADAVACQAQSDLTIAYNDAAGRTPNTTFPGPTDLGGMTLLPGVYTTPTSFAITGTLTLDAQGDPDAVFIFQAGSTLITAPNSRVVLVNGAQACNVFWQVGSSAVLGVGSRFIGTILALTSITANTNADVQGRLLARNGPVTLDSNVVTRPICAPSPTTSTSTSTSTSSTTSSTTTTVAPTTTSSTTSTSTTLRPTTTTSSTTSTTVSPTTTTSSTSTSSTSTTSTTRLATTTTSSPTTTSSTTSTSTTLQPTTTTSSTTTSLTTTSSSTTTSSTTTTPPDVTTLPEVTTTTTAPSTTTTTSSTVVPSTGTTSSSTTTTVGTVGDTTGTPSDVGGPESSGAPFSAAATGGAALARTGSDLDRLVLQAAMAMAVGLVAVASTRTRRREQLAAFQQWLDRADFAELTEFARAVSQPRRRRRLPGRPRR